MYHASRYSVADGASFVKFGSRIFDHHIEFISQVIQNAKNYTELFRYRVFFLLSIIDNCD